MMNEASINQAELPFTWALTNLGAVVNYGRTSKAEPHEIADGDWVLELEDIEKDSSRLLQKMTFLQRQSKSTKNRFDAGDVLYGKLRPYLNKVLIAGEPGYCTTEILPLKAGSHIDNRYLFYWLKHPVFLKYVEAESHGMNMPRLGTETGKAAPFVLAPRSEQTRIANQLDTLLNRIQACNDRFDAIPALLKRFRQTVLTAASTGDLTRDWRESQPAAVGGAAREIKLRLEARRDRHSAKSKSKFKEPVQPDLTHWRLELPEPWLVESVSAFSECLDHVRVPVTKDKRATAERLYPYFGANGQVDMVDDFLFDDELVMVTEDETFYGRVKPIAYRFSGRCWVNNHAHVLLAGDRVRADYLCFSLMHYDVQPWLTGTTGRAKLTQGALNALPLAVPPQAEMVEIVRRVNSMFALADRIEARCTAARAQAQRLTPLVLAKAFRGELVSQDPNDEPASALLARIASSNTAVVGKNRQKVPAALKERTQAAINL
jgi:type I restriction enzyme, S subunit